MWCIGVAYRRVCHIRDVHTHAFPCTNHCRILHPPLLFAPAHVLLALLYLSTYSLYTNSHCNVEITQQLIHHQPRHHAGQFVVTWGTLLRHK